MSDERFDVESEVPALPADRGDPVYRHAFREMVVTLVSCFVAMAWTIGWCAFDAYPPAGEPVAMLWGMPRWAVIGVLIPWGVFTLFLGWFGLCFVADDDLTVGELDGDDAGEPR